MSRSPSPLEVARIRLRALWRRASGRERSSGFPAGERDARRKTHLLAPVGRRRPRRRSRLVVAWEGSAAWPPIPREVGLPHWKRQRSVGSGAERTRHPRRLGDLWAMANVQNSSWDDGRARIERHGWNQEGKTYLCHVQAAAPSGRGTRNGRDAARPSGGLRGGDSAYPRRRR